MTHAESIALFRQLQVKMTPELTSASMTMPFYSFIQENYPQKFIDEHTAAGVNSSDVHAQSFNKKNLLYWR